MSWARLLLALCCMPLLVSCAFLLDYDALQAGEPSVDPGDGGAGGAAELPPP